LYFLNPFEFDILFLLKWKQQVILPSTVTFLRQPPNKRTSSSHAKSTSTVIPGGMNSRSLSQDLRQPIYQKWQPSYKSSLTNNIAVAYVHCISCTSWANSLPVGVIPLPVQCQVYRKKRTGLRTMNLVCQNSTLLFFSNWIITKALVIFGTVLNK